MVLLQHSKLYSPFWSNTIYLYRQKKNINNFRSLRFKNNFNFTLRILYTFMFTLEAYPLDCCIAFFIHQILRKWTNLFQLPLFSISMYYLGLSTNSLFIGLFGVLLAMVKLLHSFLELAQIFHWAFHLTIQAHWTV